MHLSHIIQRDYEQAWSRRHKGSSHFERFCSFHGRKPNTNWKLLTQYQCSQTHPTLSTLVPPLSPASPLLEGYFSWPLGPRLTSLFQRSLSISYSRTFSSHCWPWATCSHPLLLSPKLETRLHHGAQCPSKSPWLINVVRLDEYLSVPSKNQIQKKKNPHSWFSTSCLYLH